jgi:topoisomerase-4 subunit A
VTTLIELASGSSILHYFAGPATPRCCWPLSGGWLHRQGVDMFSRVKGGKSFITLDEGALPLAPT